MVLAVSRRVSVEPKLENVDAVVVQEDNIIDEQDSDYEEFPAYSIEISKRRSKRGQSRWRKYLIGYL